MTDSPMNQADRPVAQSRATRGERRKRQTRAKLLTAALDLMADKGFEAVTINEITEAADVGFGSFYNYFSSKEDIYRSIASWGFEAFARSVEKGVAGISDPALIVSAGIRHAMQTVRRDPQWGRFLLREILSAHSVGGPGIGARLSGDIQRGIRSGRFRTSDPFMAYVAVRSTVLGALVAELYNSGMPVFAQTDPGQQLAGLHERTAAMALKILGLDEKEAESVANAPLPKLDFSLREIGLSETLENGAEGIGMP